MITRTTKMATVSGGPVEVAELHGLSTDTKPTNEANGSVFLEMDTGDLYMFDAAGTTWHMI